MIRAIIGICLILLIAGTSSFAQQEPLGGQPLPGAKQSVANLYYQVKYQRAFEAVVWAIPAVSVYRLRAGAEDLGLQDNGIISFSRVATPSSLEALTANNNTPYIAGITDLRKGPVVLELPPATNKASLYGQIVDAWQVTIADVGPAGLDRGKGGKYLLIPPGYDEPLPEGYLPVTTKSHRIFLAFRSIAGKSATQQDAYDYTKKLKMYFLAEAGHPPATQFIDPSDVGYKTLPIYDERFFEDLHAIISAEPVQTRDKVMMGMLASIGIEPGKPFAPDEETRTAMRQAVVDAYFYMQQRFWDATADRLFWSDRHYSNLIVGDEAKGFTYETPNAIQIDSRSDQYFPGTMYPAKIAARPATIYMGTLADAHGNPFQAGKNYKVTLPKDVPVTQFWSLIVYDAATFSFIYNPLERAGLASLDRDKMKLNEDGSVTLYVGPNPPKGLETNWVPTEGKRPYPLFRLYGPKEEFFNDTFKFSDFDLLD